MKPLKIWEPKEDDGPQDFVRLIEDVDGDLAVAVVDEDGIPVSDGSLFCIRPRTREVLFIEDVNPDLGFALDKKGRINPYDD